MTECIFNALAFLFYVITGEDLGCFKDSETRVLTHFMEKLNTMTPQKCAELCKPKGFKYYGVEVRVFK